jgi:hypothetical protein
VQCPVSAADVERTGFNRANWSAPKSYLVAAPGTA